MTKGFWKNFFTGLVVILPAFITFTIVRIIFGWIYGLSIGPVAQLITPYVAHGWTEVLVKAGILIFFFLAVSFIGLGTRIIILRRIFSAAEQYMRRVPIVGKIYQATREITQTFQGQKSAFTRVVLIEWPRKGVYAIAFVTAENKENDAMLNVFIPTPPNPATGFLYFVEREQVLPSNLTLEEGIKLVMSGGVVGPGVHKPARTGAEN